MASLPRNMVTGHFSKQNTFFQRNKPILYKACERVENFGQIVHSTVFGSE